MKKEVAAFYDIYIRFGVSTKYPLRSNRKESSHRKSAVKLNYQRNWDDERHYNLCYLRLPIILNKTLKKCQVLPSCKTTKKAQKKCQLSLEKSSATRRSWNEWPSRWKCVLDVSFMTLEWIYLHWTFFAQLRSSNKCVLKHRSGHYSLSTICHMRMKRVKHHWHSCSCWKRAKAVSKWNAHAFYGLVQWMYTVTITKPTKRSYCVRGYLKVRETVLVNLSESLTQFILHFPLVYVRKWW